MRWIVTGGAGFIGKNLVIELLKLGRKVVVVDKLSWDESGFERIEAIDVFLENLTYFQKDHYSEWFSPDGGDTIVHLAAMSGIKECSADPVSAFETNLWVTFALLSKASEHKARCFVFASSGAVVAGDGSGDIPTEASRPRPMNVYGSMKAAGEQLCRGFAKEHGLSTAVLRFSNVYGPYSKHKKSVVHAFIQSALKGEPLTIHGDGTQARDFVFVFDVVLAIIAASNAACKSSMIYNVSSGYNASILYAPTGWKSLYDQVCEVLGREKMSINLVHGDSGVKFASLDGYHSRRRLKIGRPTPLFDGLRQTIDWYYKNM
ncbi:MAG: NAD-dependent epimerase/dehydratase family protein [Planctomycetota bacterium]|jgi:UDP-glucose 4-epimerase